MLIEAEGMIEWRRRHRRTTCATLGRALAIFEQLAHRCGPRRRAASDGELLGLPGALRPATAPENH